ncbi:leucyl aminopeptidase family protein [Bradyrhizobium sp. U87765 SZCCT0131]|uniref:leucyl aminopeptidase family protein n=1 Tax=unclassified Bradyrhizobium TaxID=2631580 RepID=UPI001BACFEC4|nr:MULTISPECIES: leucyl aminopeptidase family protein [unclassified Bradyrhizobium]MBR1222113.1 leucyl aminopeptidase family protein [Bradyrhizobium sp. U87765 SZCCT0131]MBR1263689.1 leucyl aminopeptidase family protein [Bradyrhizobium sp. U87765 SZCCT0134]MBR1302741.1 leucyl aminopeptidase family protein [Bradyrhizobium sp. U87765 SZCCT0110]MBR1319939.1 leucyl aminopeptidase family protein [Bradyrhizobium sp. U87765 SZCCT0109]MBR1348948.1 leucyl aminopeptidase family protein [Bradyrhizobium s
MTAVFAAPASDAIPITFATRSSWEADKAALSAAAQRFADSSGFTAKPGQFLGLPGPDGSLAQVLFGLDEASAPARDPFRAGQLPTLLPEGIYRFANAPDARLAALAFALGSYRFGRYRKTDTPNARLVPPDGIDAAEIGRISDAAALARDLINTPANDMGPDELAAAAAALAERFGATYACIVGEDLRAKNFPLIHAVGRASSRAPRLIDLTWGDAAHPRVTLVGKGVCFDTGGLDLKPSGSMLLMKKDMGGAANVLALAQMVMDAGLKVRLRVLIPAVENAVAGNAFRPLDVFPSRKGPTVEIGNTDAEGRLVLADALALADEDKPDLLIDLGTLTGAARVALGPDLPPFYTNDDALADDLSRSAREENDPLWRLPLWPAYDKWLDSKVADINNAPSNGFAGSITCALFLQRFVEPTTRWLHVDIYGWTPTAKPGRPEGGECQAARAIFHLLSQRYG